MKKKPVERHRESWLESIIAEYGAFVYNLAFNILRNPEDAREAAQETFLKVYKKFDQYDPAKEFKNWIAAIAVNTSRDICRKQKPHTGFDAVDERDVSDKGGMEGKIESTLLAEEILDFLDFDYRTVLVLFYIENLSVEEIAQTLNLPQILIRVRLYRARRKILEKFGRMV